MCSVGGEVALSDQLKSTRGPLAWSLKHLLAQSFETQRENMPSTTRRRLGLRLVGVLLALGGIVLVFLFGSIFLNESRNPDYYCQALAQAPVAVLEPVESGATGEISYLPLGVSCTFRSAEGQELTVPASWDATFGLAGGTFVFLVGVAFITATTKRRESVAEVRTASH